MIIKQTSVFVENKPGRLSDVVKTVSDAGCNILALTIADTADFGVMRFITDDIDKADAALRKGGFASSKTNVLTVKIPDRVGGLSEALQLLSRSGIDVEYMYVFVAKAESTAQVVMRVADVNKAQTILYDAGYDN